MLAAALAQTTTSDGGAAIGLLIFLGIGALVVYGTYRVAVNNGRSGGLAILLGILFGLFALAGYALAGPKVKTTTSIPARSDARR